MTKHRGTLIFLIIIAFLIQPLTVNVSAQESFQKNTQLTNLEQFLDSTSNLTPEQMFKLDPTNPTQVLKYEMMQKEKQNVKVAPKESVVQDNVGDQVSFWIIDSFATYPYSYTQVTATLLAIGTHSYVYVTNSIINDYGSAYADSLAEDWKTEFDTRIYPNNTAYFGDPSGVLGDIDGDPHVTILLCELDGGVAGYFDPTNEYVGTTSNEREMVYVDFQQDYGVLAHEFQHLIHYNHDQEEHWWVDEGCAEFTRYINDYLPATNLTYFASQYFVHHSEDSLLYWNYESIGGYDVRIDYGGAYMFVFYFAEKFGAVAVQDLVASSLHAAEGVENAAQNAGYSLTFNEIYFNWITALSIDDTTHFGGVYGFMNLDVSMDRAEHSIYPKDVTDILHRYYGFQINHFSAPPDFLMVNFSIPTSYMLGLSIAVYDSEGLHVSTYITSSEDPIVINGTDVTEVFIMSSIMSSTTPSVIYDNQFGLGYTENLDMTVTPGKPITVSAATYSYTNDSWTLSVSDVVVVDENNSIVNQTSGINVSAVLTPISGDQIRYTFDLDYNELLAVWFSEFSVKHLPEGDYQLTIEASGNQRYGKKDIDIITIEHILSVEKPTIIQPDASHIEILGNATYTQDGGWEALTLNAEVKAVIYDSEGDIVSLFDLTYDITENSWTTGSIDLSSWISGTYYAVVKFKYADRTVTSDPSDTFTIEGVNPPTSNTRLLNFGIEATVISLTIFAIAMVVFRKKIRK